MKYRNHISYLEVMLRVVVNKGMISLFLALKPEEGKKGVLR